MSSHHRPLVALTGLLHLEGRLTIKYLLITLQMRLSDVRSSNLITEILLELSGLRGFRKANSS